MRNYWFGTMTYIKVLKKMYCDYLNCLKVNSTYNNIRYMIYYTKKKNCFV